MVSLRLDSLLARRSSVQRAAVQVSARQQDDDDAIWGRTLAVVDGTASLLERDEDEADDKFQALDDGDDDDDSTSFPPPPPATPPIFSPPPDLTTSPSTKSTKSSESDTESDSINDTIYPSDFDFNQHSANNNSADKFSIIDKQLITANYYQQWCDLPAVGLIVGLFWGAILIRRRRRRHGQDELNPSDYPSRIGQRSRFNVNLPSLPALPFSFTTPLDRFYKPKPEAIPKRQVSNPFNARHVSGHRNDRSDSAILNEAIQAAYQMEGGHSDAVPRGFLDEKRRDPHHLLPLLDPQPIEQASIRKSVVSWFKRSSRHHPLKLNPASGSLSLRSSTGSTSTGGRRSRPGSQATSRTVSYYSNSGESVVAESSGARRMQDVPPLPDLDLQKAYTNNAATAPTAQSPTESTSESVTAPLPVFTRDDAQAYYKSMWAGSSVSGSTERMSAMSSWTDVTRTTMAGGRSSAMNTPGLSPPPSFHSSLNRTSAYPQTPITPGYTSTTGPSPSGEGTRTREDLYALYAPTRGSVAGSAVGLGLQQQLQQQSQDKPADASGGK
ncbi:hypothetical protein INS49_004995 [Diaporthe citri]|uniref:uncharacterized protein n=1 Tax=Diaporthe citri TaxID=83186 RepID=UPI001C7F2195|nr:uncharacterized protein INS49_004995 [Diaporthe citri]KAG6354024.1 hypothetical protein INS49_004995 [Diaporthe citri]